MELSHNIEATEASDVSPFATPNWCLKQSAQSLHIHQTDKENFSLINSPLNFSMMCDITWT